jgi:O-antigen/teichoic acid export membrane protein
VQSRVWSRPWRFLSGMHALALADQAVVSGTSFLTTVLVGRWAGSSQLGTYAIGLSVLVSAFAIQDALISLPYTIHQQQESGTAAERAGNSLIYSGIFSAAVVVVLALIALGLSAYRERSPLQPAIWTLAGVAPFALLRQFGRRVLFAHLHVQRALALDVAVAAIQISLLAALGWTGLMSAVLAFDATGGACALPSFVWLVMMRREFVIRWRDARTALRSNWDLGKWLLSGQLTVQVQSYSNYWLSTAIMGAAATGIYAACMSVVSAVNPFISGLTNILAPRSVLAWSAGGGERLRTQAIRDGLLLGFLASSFCILILFGGEKFIRLLYHGQDYAGLGNLVTVLSVALLMEVVGVPASNALASMQRTREIALACSAGAAVTVLAVWPLMVGWGLLGAAYGQLIGNTAGSIGRWIMFLSLVRQSSDNSRLVMSVLEQLTRDSDGLDDWEISRLGQGTHALVYEVRSKGRAWSLQAQSSLVIKLFKPAAALSVEMIHAEFQALSRFSSLLDGRLVFGWKIAVPKPLNVCGPPFALVMTRARGTDLDAWTATGEDLTPEILDEMARVTARAMQEAWAVGQLHGDLSLQNIMCDAEAKCLSFIDFGTRESCTICNGDAGAKWKPAIRDIAHTLFDVGTDVKRSIGNRSARSRRQAFAKSMLQEVLDSLPTPEHKRKLLDETADCTNVHLRDLIVQSWSLRGLWGWCVRLVAVRRVDSLLAELRAGLDGGKQSAQPLSFAQSVFHKQRFEKGQL